MKGHRHQNTIPRPISQDMLTVETALSNNDLIWVKRVLAGLALLTKSLTDLDFFHLVACPSPRAMKASGGSSASGWLMSVKKAWWWAGGKGKGEN